MYRTGHQGVNLLLFAPVLAALAVTGQLWLGAIGVVVVFTTASMPDIDVRLPLVSHRGITHTVWAALGVGLATAVPVYSTSEAIVSSMPELAVYEPVTLGAYTGGVVAFSVLGHLVGDALTPMGIRPLAPLSNRSYSLGLWTADSIANKVLFGLGVGALAGTVALVSLV